MKEDYNIKDPKVDDLINRLRFKLPEYDTISNYKRLQERINTPVISLSKNISPAWKWFSIAASFALLVVSAFHFIDLSRPELVWYEVAAVPDAKTKIVLPDSSTVWLNANARLVYPRSFEDVNRKVSISGEAFFQVRKDKNHPFIVDIGKLQVEVLGTSFNVMTDTYNDEIRISLLEGKVALYEKGQSSKLITGKFSFEDNTLAEIGEELERAFHVKIHIENEAIRKKTFNATFEDKETLDEILSILQISAKYKMEKKRGEIYIY